MPLKDELKKVLLEKHPVLLNVDDWVLVRCNAFMRSMSDIGYLKGTLTIADIKNSRIFSPFSHGIFHLREKSDVTVIKDEKKAKPVSFEECCFNAMYQIYSFYKGGMPEVLSPRDGEDTLIIEYEPEDEDLGSVRFLKFHIVSREEIEAVIDGYWTCNQSHLAVFDLKNFGIKMGNVSVIRKFKYEA